MEIKGLDYNTHRGRLELSEYGREVQKMVDHALTISDRHERQLCAEEIVKTMQRVSPLMSKDEDSTHKYWDHLALMSDFRLDIDYPFDVEQAHKIHTKPRPVAYSQENDVCHYGELLFATFRQLKTMPKGEERDQLTRRTANMMLYCLKEYSQGNVSEEKVASDLAHYTDGVIQLDLDNFRFTQTHPLPTTTGKRKKKK